jgi:PAS domain S-box-containing protein/putative nucleotidyltransferase with HDIG domain
MHPIAHLQMIIKQNASAVKIAGLYFFIGCLWILFSDKLAASVARDNATLVIISLYKGWAYVFITALFLFWLVWRDRRDLLASEQRFRLLFENNPLPMWLVDQASLQFLEVNEAAIQHYGYIREEFLSMSEPDLRLPEESSSVQNKYVKFVPDLRHRCKDGRMISVQTAVHPFKLENKQVALTAAIDITERKQMEGALRQANQDLRLSYDATIEGWSRALEVRDRETEGHTQRVTRLTMDLAQEMGLSAGELIHVRRGALLHDIGKMGVPDQILLKPARLTKVEWQIMRQHPLLSYNLLARIDFLRPALDIPRYHHERWDGSGYPTGLKGEQIPLAARIFAVIDVWDALTSDRPYRKRWGRKKALEFIQAQSGKYFDPKVVEMFMGLIARETYARSVLQNRKYTI